MPITIKSSRMQYRKSNGDYVGVDAVSERKTSEYISDIETIGNETRSAIDTKAQQARDSIPSDYTALSDEVSDLKSQIKQNYGFFFPIQQGYWAIASGDFTSSTNWCCSKGYIEDDIILKTSTLRLFVQAYNKDTDEYVGVWNPIQSNFTTSYVPSAYVQEFSVREFINRFPNYLFKLTIYDGGNTLIPSDALNAITVEKSDLATRSEINNIIEMSYGGETIISSDQIIRGGATSDGYPTAATTVIRTKDLYLIPAGSEFILTPGTKCAKVLATEYSLDRTFIQNIPNSWQTTQVRWVSTRNSLYCFTFQSASDELLATDYDGEIKIRTSIDKRLSEYDGGVLPTYFATEVNTCVNTLVENCEQKSLVIAFNTDNHYGASNGMNWPDTIGTIKAVNDKYPIDAIINGGDLINGDETFATDVQRLNEMISSMKKVNVLTYATIGNHDDGSFTASETPLLTQGELFSTIARHMCADSDNIALNKSYCYKDFDSLGIRLIILDSHISNGDPGASTTTWGYDQTQLTWVENEALDTDKQIVIFSHMGVTKEYSGANNQIVNGPALRTIIETFIANGGVVAGLFHGHTHFDFIGKYSNTNGFYEISTGCSRVVSGPITDYSWYYPTGATMPVREINTVTQELWDLIVIKPESREVKMIRFGAGDDRSFTY